MVLSYCKGLNTEPNRQRIKCGLLLIGVLVMSLLLTASGGSEPVATPVGLSDSLLERQPYIYEAGEFRINPPDGWTVDESGMLGARVSFFSPEVDLLDDVPFTANINVVTEPAQGLDLKGYVEASKEVLPRFFTAHALIEDINTKVRGRQAHFLGSKRWSRLSEQRCPV